SQVSGNGAGFGEGGGLYNAGVLTLINSLVSNNSNGDGSGIYNAGTLTVQDSSVHHNMTSFSGPGIYNVGTLTLMDSSVYGNEAAGFLTGSSGGGLFNSGAATVINSQLYSNTVGSDGGGIYNTGVLTLTDSAVYSNTALRGGGVHNSGTLLLANSAVYSNTADEGGGLYAEGGLVITNTTISGNRQFVYGGGGLRTILPGGIVTLNNVTLANNSGGGLSIVNGSLYPDRLPTARNSIIAHNVGGNCDSGIISAGYNLESDTTCGLAATGDLSNTDPLLGPLADNGGAPGALTHALLPGSPAIDAGSSVCAATDQRGVARPQGLRCDIGAFEVVSLPRAEFNMPLYLTPKNAGVFVATVVLAIAPAATATVDYATSDGTALAGQDYLPATGTLTFAPGVTGQTIPITILNNPANTASRALTLTLSNPTGVVLGPVNPATLVIAAQVSNLFLPLLMK
ncbi:MAG: choice-of-anchor Q domain-containing protein, partial [Anaerolineales bacterium]